MWTVSKLANVPSEVYFVCGCCQMTLLMREKRRLTWAVVELGGEVDRDAAENAGTLGELRSSENPSHRPFFFSPGWKCGNYWKSGMYDGEVLKIERVNELRSKFA